MSNISLAQQKMLELAAKKAQLDARNKEAARIQLMRIQIILARRPIK